MSTLEMIASWNTRHGRTAGPVGGRAGGRADLLDRHGRRYNGDRTRMQDLAEPLRDVAARQADVLRAAGSTGARDAKLAEMRAKVDAVRAAQAAPAPQARPGMASVVKPTFKQVDAMLADIPVGVYALPRRADAKNGRQPVYFFKVHPWRNGKRVVMLSGGVGGFTEHTMSVVWQAEALRKIGADIREAAALYGREISECGFCRANGRHSPLTHERSRKAGYGQHCAEKHGLPW